MAAQLLQTMVLARILFPSDFGLMAVTGAVVAVLLLLADMGMSRTLIHFDALTPTAFSTLYWLNLIASILVGGALALAAPMISAAFDSPELIGVLRAACLLLPISAVGQQFKVLAEKDLRFSKLAKIEIVAATMGLVAAVLVAVNGGGVYALVAGLLVPAASSALLSWVFLSAGHRPRFHFDLSEVKPQLQFGAYLIGDGMASTLNRQADVVVAGLALGPGSIGMYSVPRDLNLRVANFITPIITRVGFPVMSRVQHDPALVKSVYLQTLRMTTAVNFPLYAVLGVFASEVVIVLYGPRWQEAATFLRILSAWGLIRSTGNPVGSLLYAVGRPRTALFWNLTLLAAFPPVLWAGSLLAGLEGVAIAALLLQIGILGPMWRYLVKPYCGATFNEYLGTMIAPFILSLASAGLALSAVTDIEEAHLRLGIGLLVGAAAYAGLSLLFNRSWATTMIRLVRWGEH
jgi:O-antigen/teichoic acid export membrane protein